MAEKRLSRAQSAPTAAVSSGENLLDPESLDTLLESLKEPEVQQGEARRKRFLAYFAEKAADEVDDRKMALIDKINAAADAVRKESKAAREKGRTDVTDLDEVVQELLESEEFKKAFQDRGLKNKDRSDRKYTQKLNLSYVNLRGCDLSNCYLVGANMSPCTLVGADLTGANL